MLNRLKDPRIMMILSMAVFGTLGPFVRNISVSSSELALYRAVLAVLLISVYFIVTKQRLALKSIRKEAPILLLSGVAVGINWILLFEAYKYTTVSVATLCYYFAPVIVTAVCPLLFKEKITLRQVVCFIMSTIGLVLLIGVTDISGGASNIKGIAFGLGAAVFYAMVVLLNKFIKGVAGIQRTMLQFISAIAVLLPYVLLTGGITLYTLDSTGWICLLVVGLFHTGVCYCLYFSSLKELPGQEASMLSYVDPLVALLVSVFILGEQILPVQIIGGLMILGFTLWNELKS